MNIRQLSMFSHRVLWSTAAIILLAIMCLCPVQALAVHYTAALTGNITIPYPYLHCHAEQDSLLRFYNLETANDILTIYTFTINRNGFVSSYSPVCTIPNLIGYVPALNSNCLFYHISGKTAIGLTYGTTLRFIQFEGSACISDRTIPNLSNPHLYSSIYWNENTMLFTNANQVNRLYFSSGVVDTLYTSPGQYGSGVTALARNYLIIMPAYPYNVDNNWLLYDQNLNYLSSFNVTDIPILCNSMFYIQDGIDVGQNYVLCAVDGAFGVDIVYLTVIDNQLGFGDSFGYIEDQFGRVERFIAFSEDKFTFLGPWDNLSFYEIADNLFNPLAPGINLDPFIRDYAKYAQSLIVLAGMTETKTISFINQEMELTDRYVYNIPEQGTSHYTDSFVLDNAVGFINDHSYLWIFGVEEYTAITDEESNPALDIIRSISPNPFHDRLNIGINLKQPGQASIQVFNIKGQKIKDLYSQYTPKGEHSMFWDGTDNKGNPASAGVYLVKAAGGKSSQLQKVLKVK